LRILELPSCREVRRSPGRFPDARVAVSPDETTAAVAMPNGAAEIIDLRTWQTIATIPEVQRSKAVTWRQNGDFVVFGCENGSLHIYYPRLKQGHPLSGSHTMEVVDIVISRNGEFLASTGLDNVALLRKIQGDRLLFKMPGRALQFSPDGRRFALADD